MPCVIQVRTVQLSSDAKRTLSYESYKKAEDWLKSWTIGNNVKSCFANSLEEGLEKCRNELTTVLSAWFMKDYGILPSHFTFCISYQEAPGGMFWSGHGSQWLTEYTIN